MKMKTISSVRRCRLCACEENFDTFCNIFEEDPELNIELKITKLLPIVVMPWDPMPHKICNACIDKLNLFDEFYENSLRAERFLRTLHPSAPQKQLDNFDPVVEVLEPPILGKVPFALPPRNRVPPPSSRGGPPSWRPGGPDSPEGPDLRERLRNCFVINKLTSKDSIFTCRKCFRTFTKESSAWTHTCVRLEDCQEFAAVGVRADEGQKLLPPLKIRLFSIESGRFVCDLCQSPFEKKAELVAHIRRHLKEASWSEEEREKGGKEKVAKEKRQECTEEVEKEDKKEAQKEEEKENGKENESEKLNEGDEDCLKGAKKRVTQSAKAARKRKRHWGKSGKKRTKQRREEPGAEEEGREAVCAPCNGRTSLGSSPKETAESTTRLSDSVTALEDEIEIKYEKVQKVPEKITEDQQYDEDKNKEQDGRLEASKNEESGERGSDKSLMEGSMSLDIFIEDDVILEEGAERSEDVMVVQVVNSRTPTSFSSCVICDKVFATKNALITHQQKHLQRCPGVKHDEPSGAPSNPFLCSICAMTFSTRRTLAEHEQYHLVDVDAIG